MATNTADLPEYNNDKTTAAHEVSAASQTYSAEEAGSTHRPTGWKYKQLKIGSYKFPWYASPPVQLLIISLVCFMCPGMFNALNGLGGGGQVDKSAGDKANVALYSTFSVVGFFAGTITNKLGIRIALAFGGIGYSIYIASFLSYNHHKSMGFTIFAGALLGCCAGILWCAQGAIMMSYPPENAKGRYISWFWMIFNLGAVLGSLIPLGENIHVKTNSTVSDGTYIGFIVLTLIGAALSMTLVNAKDVIRADGSKVIVMKHPSWKSELLGLWETIQSDPYIIALFPMFLASNWFYAYHFNDINGAYFNTRTKSLNGILYYVMQIIGAFVFGYALDRHQFRRSTRAKAAWVSLFAIIMIIWGCGYRFQKSYTRADADAKAHPDFAKDWSDSGYVGPMFLYMFYGFSDAAWQTCVYWFMGSLTNNGRKLANFAGFYKGIQSAGSVITWRLDDVGVSYINMYGSTWGLLAASLVIALPVILWKVEDTIPLEKDIEFTDETVAEVAPAVENIPANVPLPEKA